MSEPLCEHKVNTVLSACPECARLELMQRLAGDDAQAAELWALRLEDHKEARDDNH